MPSELDTARYVSFTTYKRDGSAVSLPVWVVNYDGGYAFTTDADAFKVKRVSRDPRATLRVCDMRGRVPADAVEHAGSAVVLHGDEARAVAKLVKQKYSIGSLMLGALEAWRKLTRRGSADQSDCAIKVTLHS